MANPLFYEPYKTVNLKDEGIDNPEDFVKSLQPLWTNIPLNIFIILFRGVKIPLVVDRANTLVRFTRHSEFVYTIFFRFAILKVNHDNATVQKHGLVLKENVDPNVLATRSLVISKYMWISSKKSESITTAAINQAFASLKI